MSRPLHLTLAAVLGLLSLTDLAAAAPQRGGGVFGRGVQGQRGGFFAPISERIGGDARGTRTRVTRTRGPANPAAMKDLTNMVKGSTTPAGPLLPPARLAPLPRPEDTLPITALADDEQVALWFASCDTDGDGWMVYREATRALDFDRPRFQSFDADRDGRIDSTEFADYYRYRLTESGGFRPPQIKVTPTLATPRKAEQLRLAFDTNADRSISEEELAAVLEGYGRYDLVVGDLMDDADRNRDLLLDEDELEGIAALLIGAAGPAVSSLPAGAVSGIDQLFGAPAGPEVHEPGALPRIAGPITPYRRLDLDGDGVISLQDLESLQRPLRSPVRIGPILLALDADGDGAIDRAELRAALGDVR
jgi:Ca2+-binding EF-hand superfamily protein